MGHNAWVEVSSVHGKGKKDEGEKGGGGQCRSSIIRDVIEHEGMTGK